MLMSFAEPRLQFIGNARLVLAASWDGVDLVLLTGWHRAHLCHGHVSAAYSKDTRQRSGSGAAVTHVA